MAAGSFSLDISAFVRKAKANPRTVVKKVVLDLGTGFAVKTPVGDPDTWASPAPEGYVGGRARGGWQYAKGSPETQEPGTIDSTATTAIRRIAAGVETGDAAVEHFVTNSVPYIRELEYEGHSRQAPEGMVRVTILEFRRFVERAVRELP